MNKKNAQIILLVILILGGVGYGYVSYLLLPQMETIGNQSTGLESKKAEHITLMTYFSNPQSLEQEIEAQAIELEAQSQIIPRSLDKPLITYNIYTTLKRNHLIGDNMVFETSENNGTYQFMNLSVSVSGIPSDVFRAIDEFQNSTDALVLRSTEFTALEEEALLQAEVQLQAFALPANQRRTDPLPFMNAPIGVDNINDLFTKKVIPDEI